MSTALMIDAFVGIDQRGEWHSTLADIRCAHGCPCTTTTHAIPRARGVTTGGMWMEIEDFVCGRPVSNCGLCGGVGVSRLLAVPDTDRGV